MGTPQIKGEKLTCTQDGPKRKASFTTLKEQKGKVGKWIKQRHVVDAPPVLLLRIKTSKSYSKQTNKNPKQTKPTNKQKLQTNQNTNKQTPQPNQH